MSTRALTRARERSCRSWRLEGQLDGQTREPRRDQAHRVEPVVHLDGRRRRVVEGVGAVVRADRVGVEQVVDVHADRRRACPRTGCSSPTSGRRASCARRSISLLSSICTIHGGRVARRAEAADAVGGPRRARLGGAPPRSPAFQITGSCRRSRSAAGAARRRAATGTPR